MLFPQILKVEENQAPRKKMRLGLNLAEKKEKEKMFLRDTQSLSCV